MAGGAIFGRPENVLEIIKASQTGRRILDDVFEPAINFLSLGKLGSQSHKTC